jgi:hypothetical protein
MKRTLLLLILFVLPLCALDAQDKKPPEKKDAPTVRLAIPLGVPVGKATKVVLRGQKLDAVTEVRFPDVKVIVKILAKGKATVPAMQDAKLIGDTQVEVEVTLPPETPEGAVALVVVGPDGESAPHKLLVEKTIPVVAEKEPNNGFKQAQPIALPQAVDGVISQAQDVDVYRFEGKAGQKIVIEVLAARHRSALDSILSLHDADGRLLGTNDDIADSVDSRLEVTLPKDGAYFASVIDAHDSGGPAHVYRLVVRPERKP